MTTLVTGATGFLGAALVDRLLARGETDLRCLVRTANKRSVLEPIVARDPSASVELHQGGLGSVADAARALEGVSVVYHLAAALGGAPADMFLGTVVASKNLLEAAAAERRTIRLVLVSSFGVYGTAPLQRGSVVDETTSLESHPEKRDPYSQTKLRQEKLFRDYASRFDLPLTVLRPGVIYGPRGSALSARIGLDLAGLFLALGGSNVLPLSYVDNCAEAIAIAGERDDLGGQVFNVHDDDLPTCSEYLAAYRRQVRPLRALRVPYPAMLVLSAVVERYHAYSKGQLPAFFTRYKTATTWKGNRFDNTRLKSIGWRQLVSTDEGMRRTFGHLRASIGAR